MAESRVASKKREVQSRIFPFCKETAKGQMRAGRDQTPAGVLAGGTRETLASKKGPGLGSERKSGPRMFQNHGTRRLGEVGFRSPTILVGN